MYHNNFWPQMHNVQRSAVCIGDIVWIINYSVLDLKKEIVECKVLMSPNKIGRYLLKMQIKYWGKCLFKSSKGWRSNRVGAFIKIYFTAAYVSRHLSVMCVWVVFILIFFFCVLFQCIQRLPSVKSHIIQTLETIITAHKYIWTL